jgi:hypothetical protein
MRLHGSQPGSPRPSTFRTTRGDKFEAHQLLSGAVGFMLSALAAVTAWS